MLKEEYLASGCDPSQIHPGSLATVWHLFRFFWHFCFHQQLQMSSAPLGPLIFIDPLRAASIAHCWRRRRSSKTELKYIRIHSLRLGLEVPAHQLHIFICLPFILFRNSFKTSNTFQECPTGRRPSRRTKIPFLSLWFVSDLWMCNQPQVKSVFIHIAAIHNKSDLMTLNRSRTTLFQS